MWITHTVNYTGGTTAKQVMSEDSSRKFAIFCAKTGNCELAFGPASDEDFITLKEGEIRSDLPTQNKVMYKGDGTTLSIIAHLPDHDITNWYYIRMDDLYLYDGDSGELLEALNF